ncbi:MAG: PepSY domain-containing protein [Gemmatimonadaceae bacterium]
MKHEKLARAATIAFAVLVSAGTLAAQGTYKKELPAKLAKQAKITEAAAAVTAQAKVPNGTIQGVELEKEKGKLMYSYDIKIPGADGIEEVNINAMDGSVIAVEHESAASEAKEKKKEAAMAKKRHDAMTPAKKP